MFSMALIPCPTHDSCDLCNKKIIYVQMWREKVTSLIAKTSCDWYKFNIGGHFQTPGGARWLVYTGQLPGNRAGLHGPSLLHKQMDGYTTGRRDRSIVAVSVSNTLQGYTQIYPEVLIEAQLDSCTKHVYKTVNVDKDTECMKWSLRVTSKIKTIK